MVRKVTRQSVLDQQRRLSQVPPEGVLGSEIIDELELGAGRRATLMKDGGFEPIDPNKIYRPTDVLGRSGKPFKVQDIPDRTKGASDNSLFRGKRSALSKAIITEQIESMALNLYTDDDGIEFDDEDADWVVFPKFFLPKNWKGIARTSPVLVVFPTAYPEIPPVGFYMTEQIPFAPNGHFYEQAYHDAATEPLSKGWKWYCVYVAPGTWRPAPVRRLGDWMRGDNLWIYHTLIKEALATAD